MTDKVVVYFGSGITQDAYQAAVTIYSKVYNESPYLEGAVDFQDFADSLSGRMRQTSARMALLFKTGAPVGFAIGHELPPDSTWWDGLALSQPPEVTREWSGRTFAVIELAVLRENRRGGVGRILHSHLTTDLHQQRLTLLVRPDAYPAQCAYSRWGYEYVGKLRPRAAGPVYDAMIKQLAKT